MSLAHVAIPAALRGVHREDDAFALAAAWGLKVSGLFFTGLGLINPKP